MSGSPAKNSSLRLRNTSVGARGVILAVRRGVTEPEIDLIRSTGFWERALLAAGDAEADPCSLVVAVTHVDSLVEHRIMDGEPDAESVAACYRSVRDELTHVIKQQTRAELAKLSEVEGADPGMRESRERASREILEGLQVCPVSAFDYRKLATENPRLPPLAGTAEDTGIPTLARHLAEIGARNRESLRALRQDSADRLVSIAQAAIDQAIASWTEGTRQQAEATRLRAELGRFLDPIRRARGSLRGQFREFLDHTAAILIGWMVERAQADARKRVGRYLDGLRDAPWATLKAAVCRGGTFDGARRIDLPHDIAQHFQEPTAAAWGGTDGVQEVRKRTGAYGEATSALVGEILEWAKSWSGEPVSPEILAALERGADARAKQLGQIGREAADELRKAVRDKLLATTKPRIALACQEFVRRGDAQGRGVKLRMLELFAGLADDSVSAASEVAHALLQERFNEVRAEIFRILEVCGDPIESAGEAIAPAEQRADDDRRADIIGRLRAARPTPTAEPV